MNNKCKYASAKLEKERRKKRKYLFEIITVNIYGVLIIDAGFPELHRDFCE